MNFITITPENLEREHICCAISNNRDCQVASKKAWLSDRLSEGLVFRKADVRGKAFVEYIPAEKAWCPIKAPGYLFIDCLWVSGQYKGQGISRLLLEDCIRDAKEQGKEGVCVLSSPKKKPYLSDPKFFRYFGFQPADAAPPYFELLYLPLKENAEKPAFCPSVKEGKTGEPGFVLYYCNQCPFTAKYVPLLEKLALEKGAPMRVIKFESAEQAQAAPSPFTSFSLFYDGAFVTNEILSEKKFEKLLLEKGFGAG